MALATTSVQRLCLDLAARGLADSQQRPDIFLDLILQILQAWKGETLLRVHWL